MKCNKCKHNFSDHLIQPLCINGKYIKTCPICALKTRNKEMGLPMNTLFSGEQAQLLYEEALMEIKED